MVTIEPYNPEWPRRYREQADQIQAALGSRVTALEHIGSTVVPGLNAKPIIDMAACASPGIDAFDLEGHLIDLGYVQHRSGPKTHAVYIRANEHERLRILHVFDAIDWSDCNQRLFRDKLLNDGAARNHYGELKRQLAASSSTGLDYTAGKRDLIHKLLNEERASRGLAPTVAWDK